MSDDKVVAVGANAIRDGERYLVAILLPAAGQPLTEDDIGAAFEVRDTALFFGHTVRLCLTGLPEGELDMAEFRPFESPNEDTTASTAA
ncbi:MAG: hypothetical protein ACE5FP_08885 [Gemmatimonadota bacterium]